MRVVIAGSSGLIGTALREAYESDGAQVVRLVRRPPRGPKEVRWDPMVVSPGLLDGANVVINLAGAGLGDRRWTRKYGEAIRSTRVVAAQTLARAVAKSRPDVLLSMSGIRFYGIDRGDEVLTESSAPGTTGLLTQVSREWEAATAPASEAGVRVCHLRTGLVLSGRGGLLPPLIQGCRFGLTGGFWTGHEYWSCVSLHDAVRAVRFLAEADEEGPVNVSAPSPMRNADLMRLLRDLLRTRLALPFPIPQALLRIGLGRIADEVFGGLRVLPERLREAGFTFTHPDVEDMLRAALSE
ncbi:TIGR01777 family oxidoreductase [Tenggerimyces flavus]|uniref:TIGR01777 family oxidoreductase n=1 Tax=Tenggerimyces flavus TaxID=1708749 RepID=A0ABV7YAK6_9ACTN|nr:TIGR01777 family oxidoreductase [Tenggerimyces flavus]MBM7786151.1 uncharacterized protein (TIGR01777 family) [Tenggerimyces flavus]